LSLFPLPFALLELKLPDCFAANQLWHTLECQREKKAFVVCANRSHVTSEEIDRADTIFVLKIGQKRALRRISAKAKTKTSVLGFSQSHKLGNVGVTRDKSLARAGGKLLEEFSISKRRRVEE
jgi:hypothetical protein